MTASRDKLEQEDPQKLKEGKRFRSFPEAWDNEARLYLYVLQRGDEASSGVSGCCYGIFQLLAGLSRV